MTSQERTTSSTTKDYYDIQADRKSFEVGDAVWLRNLQGKPAIHLNGREPGKGYYRVTKPISDMAYHMIQPTPQGLPYVHGNCLFWGVQAEPA